MFLAWRANISRDVANISHPISVSLSFMRFFVALSKNIWSLTSASSGADSLFLSLKQKERDPNSTITDFFFYLLFFPSPSPTGIYLTGIGSLTLVEFSITAAAIAFFFSSRCDLSFVLQILVHVIDFSWCFLVCLIRKQTMILGKKRFV